MVIFRFKAKDQPIGVTEQNQLVPKTIPLTLYTIFHHPPTPLTLYLPPPKLSRTTKNHPPEPSSPFQAASLLSRVWGWAGFEANSNQPNRLANWK